MIDREHKLSIARQTKLLGFSRGSVYYSPRSVSGGDLALMRRIDELHLDYPLFAGSRRSPSRWTARVRGGTLSSSSGSDVRSNMKRSISTPIKRCPRLTLASVAI